MSEQGIQPGSARGKPCVLVAEPREPLRQALQDALGGAFRVLAARTSDGAVMGFEDHRPPVVLVSMEQDRGDGFELCRKLSRLPGADRTLLAVYGAPPPDLPEYRDREIQQQYGVGRYIPQGASVRALLDLAAEHVDSLRARGRFVATGAPAREPAPGGADDADERRNPMVARGVVSARKTDDSGTFSLRRLLRRKG